MTRSIRLAMTIVASLVIIGFGVFHEWRTGLVQRAWFMHNIKSLRDSTMIRVAVGDSSSAWRTTETVTNTQAIREIVEDLTRGGADACSPERSACPFLVKLTFVAGGGSRDVFLGIDDCHQFYMNDSKWQGTFDNREGSFLRYAIQGPIWQRQEDPQTLVSAPSQ